MTNNIHSAILSYIFEPVYIFQPFITLKKTDKTSKYHKTYSFLFCLLQNLHFDKMRTDFLKPLMTNAAPLSTNLSG